MNYKLLYMINKLLLLVGWLVGFYGISTLIGYLMPNPVYMYMYVC